MNYLDDTTTNRSFDDSDDDKTLILKGTERLRYFRDIARPPQQHTQSSRSFLRRLLNRLRRH